MTQDEQYEAAVQKRFHLEMLARRLGWSEGSPERSYADRCSLGQPHQRGLPAIPGPMRHFPQQRTTYWKISMPDAPSLLCPTQVEHLWTHLSEATHL